MTGQLTTAITSVLFLSSIHFHFSLSRTGEGNDNLLPGMGEPGGLPSMGSHRVTTEAT